MQTAASASFDSDLSLVQAVEKFVKILRFAGQVDLTRRLLKTVTVENKRVVIRE